MDAITVVVVDDSEVYVSGIEAWLEQWPELELIGIARDGLQGCETVERLRPDLVVMDAAMPGLNGFEATRRIKSLENPPKVVMLTIDDTLAARNAARAVGADDFVAKSLVTTALLPAVRRLFLRPGINAERQPWIERVLARFATDVTTASGTRFFDLLVEYVAGCLGFDFVVIGEVQNGDPRRVQVIAVSPACADPAEVSPLLASAPCEGVAGGQAVSFTSGVRDTFPADRLLRSLRIESFAGTPLVSATGEVVGTLCGFGRTALVHSAAAALMLRLVASRAVAELERERARREIEQSEAHFRLLIEQTQDVVALIDDTDAVTYVSPSVERWLGYRPEECVGMKAIDLVHPSDQPRIQEILTPTGEDRAGCFHEARIRHRDGGWRTMESSCAEHTDANGRCFRVVTARDLTERRSLEDQLRQSQKIEVIGRLAGGIAHDFNNILMAIVSNSDLLEQRTGPDNPNRRFLTAIRDAVVRGKGLAGQLLAFNRQREFQPKMFELNHTIATMAQFVGRLVGPDVRLVTRLAPEAGLLLADPTQIEQVVLNLVINARDAMPDGGEITIETAAAADVAGASDDAGAADDAGDEARPGVVMFAVTDTGHGMSEEVKARIFEPLFTTKEEGRGTGLGLATVQGIVTRHGGTIEVDSVEGRGSTFRIFLPRC